MDTSVEIAGTSGARIFLRGHGSVAAQVEVVEYPKGIWLLRTLGYVVLWWLWTTATLLFTFDPFIASFPFVIGLALVYKSWKGRYQINAFRGSCPRCGEELQIKAGTKVTLPHPLVCYHCHHEPELVL